ncbi:MAG: ABC transporter permease, partial [Selenomonadaceae bacterium]|nr:ABC transporter permease [Selenomonadaceae bacterium]
MLFRECFIMALTSIKANGMRSLLTMLGIIIGVGAVVAMVALGDGVKAQTTDSFGELGANTLNIMPEGGRNRGVRQARSAMQSLKTMDAEAIEKKVKGVQYVSPVVSSSYQVVYGNENVNTNVRGVKPAYLQKNSITVKNGYFITNDANENRLRVAVLGNTVAVNLFGEDNPVGKQIRINNQPFRVIGIMDTTGASGMGEDQDDVILVPFTT